MSLAFLRAQLKLITPLFMGGADSRALDDAGVRGRQSTRWTDCHNQDSRALDDAGVRGASLRAALRFWYRAAAGPALGHNAEALFRAESDLFGATQGEKQLRRATFALQLGMPWPVHNSDSFELLPHRTQNASPAGAYKPGQIVDLAFVRHSRSFKLPFAGEHRDPQEVKRAVHNLRASAATLWLWSHLGALGKRSRRGAGSFWLLELTKPPEVADLPIAPYPADLEALVTHLQTGVSIAVKWICDHALSIDGCIGGIPNSNYFHITNAPVVAGRLIPGIYVCEYCGTAEGARKELSQWTSATKSAFPANYGEIMGRASPRQASPVIGRIAPLANGRHAIVLAVSGSFPSTQGAAVWKRFTSFVPWSRI